MINLYVWLLLAIPTALEATCDYIDYKKAKPDKKSMDVVIRLSLMIVLGFVVQGIGGESWWQSAILSLGIFTMTFDYLMGFLLVKNPFFLGTTSQFDSIWSRLPRLQQLFVRGILFASSVAVYYDLSRIITL